MNPTINEEPFKTGSNPMNVEDDRTGNSVETLKRALADNLFYVQGKFRAIATNCDSMGHPRRKRTVGGFTSFKAECPSIPGGTTGASVSASASRRRLTFLVSRFTQAKAAIDVSGTANIVRNPLRLLFSWFYG